MTARPDEEGLIARFFAPLATDPGAARLTDDAAVLVVPEGFELVLKTDAVVAGVHFFPHDDPALIAKKALRVNLSDLAAKGATPRGYLMTLALPDDWTVDWLDTFARGLAEDQALYGLSLFGGDTTRAAGPLLVSITAFGLVPEGHMPRRSDAKPGDVVVVTGTIGDGALGCRLLYEPRRGEGLSAADREHLHRRYWLPEPRLALADAVLAHAHATMDVSDGLAGDLAKLCRASGVAAQVEVERVPLSGAARALIATDEAWLTAALTGGDDYEILMTAAPAELEALVEAGQVAGVPITPIGRIATGEGAHFTRAGQALDLGRGSYSHF